MVSTNATFTGDVTLTGTLALPPATAPYTSNFVKQGAGNLTLTQASQYVGTTTISQGTLTLDNNSAIGAGALTISNGATLGLSNGINLSNATALNGSGTVSVPTGTATLSVAISNGAMTGSLTKASAGSLVLSNTNSYTGGTTVNAGTLIVNGSIASSSLTTISAGGTLKGNGGHIGPLTVQGNLTPGLSIGTLTIHGNLTLDSTSITTIEINDAGQTSQLIVTDGGTVTIASGAILVVVPQAGSYVEGTRWTFLTSSGVSGAQLQFTPPTELPSLIVEYNVPVNGSLSLFFATPVVPIVSIPTEGLQSNSAALAQYLNSLVDAPELESGIDTLSLLSGKSLETALASLDPLRLASTNFALFNSQFVLADLLSSRLSNYRLLRYFPFIAQWERDTAALTASLSLHEKNQASPNQTVPSYSLWTQGFGVLSHEKGRDTNPSFDVTSWGFFSAFEAFPWETGLIGIGASYIHNGLDQKDNFGKSSSDMVVFGLYGSYSKSGFFLDGSCLGSSSQIKSDREIFFPGFVGHAKAKYHSWQVSPHLDFGYSFLFASACIEPFVSFDWPILWTPAIRETGASPWNMRIQSRTSSMLRGVSGVNFYQKQMGQEWLIGVKETLSYVYQKPFSVGRVSAFLVGQPGLFTVATFSRVEQIFSPAFELFIQKKSGFFTSFTYVGEFGSGYVSNEILGKIGYAF